MIPLSAAAARLGVSTVHVAKLCRDGRIPGAKRIGARMWVVPNRFTVTPGTRGPKASFAKPDVG